MRPLTPEVSTSLQDWGSARRLAGLASPPQGQRAGCEASAASNGAGAPGNNPLQRMFTAPTMSACSVFAAGNRAELRVCDAADRGLNAGYLEHAWLGWRRCPRRGRTILGLALEPLARRTKAPRENRPVAGCLGANVAARGPSSPHERRISMAPGHFGGNQIDVQHRLQGTCPDRCVPARGINDEICLRLFCRSFFAA